MMAELSAVTSESNVVGKGFNLARRIGERSPLSPEDPNFNNNNNEINPLEIPRLPSNSPFAVTNSTTNSSSRSPSQKIDSRIERTSPMMQITQLSSPQSNKKNEEGPELNFEKDDISSGPRVNNSEERLGQYSPVDKSLRRSGTSLSFEDSSKSSLTLPHNKNYKNNNSSSRDFPIHQVHDEEDELINSEDDDNMILEDEEDYSENEELMPGEDEDSEKDEHRITVREALMSRAFHAAKFGSGGKYSSTGSGGTTGTSRSGMISPSSSPGGPHSQLQHGSMGNNPLIKNPTSNGHGMRGDHRHGHGQHHGHGHHRSSFGSTGSHHSSSNSNHHHHHHLNSRKQYQQQQQLHHHDEPFIKSERKSHTSSPNQCDLKPDSLATESSLNGIGNALLSLASLGSLAALQQSIPNFMANVVGSGGLGHHHPSLQQQQQNQQQQQQNQNSSQPGGGAPTLMNVPLNLTHSNTNSSTLTSNILSNSMGSSNHPHYPHHPQHHQKQSKQQQQSHHSPNSLISSSLQNVIAKLAANGGGEESLIPSAQGSMPQFLLASGQISQGIQGAQLLIPTSHGVMTQTVLTIPITQPGSPQMLSPSQQQQLHNATGGVGGNVMSGGHHGHNQGHNMNLGGHRNICHPHSPSMTAGLPSSASPDFPGAPGALPSPLMNIAPHLVGGHLPTIQEKMAMDHNGGGLNGLRNAHGKRERESNSSHNNPGGLSVSALCPPKSSPCSAGGSSHGSDRCSDIDDSDQMVDGINLDEIKEFAKAFKLRRLSLGLTQTQVGQALSVTEGPAYSQSAICSALAWQLAQSQSQSYPPSSIHQQPMFEKLDITPKSAQKIKPVLERWMKEAEERYKNGHQNLNEFVGMEPSKKRKRRTSFTPQALEILNNHFERNTHPSGAEITTLAHQLGYEREVIRIWFCNKRQALKNTVRMMSK